MTRMAAATLIAGAAVVAIVTTKAAAQDEGPAVGDLAPDFTLRGSTRDGLLAKPVHLAEFRGQTVVLAFFPKARTKG